MTMAPSINLTPIQITEANFIPSKPSGMRSRGRSNSIVKVEEIGETQDQVLDQSLYVNLNVEWVNRKGN